MKWIVLAVAAGFGSGAYWAFWLMTRRDFTDGDERW